MYSWQVSENFHQTDDCEAGGIDDGAHSGSLHFRSGAAEDVNLAETGAEPADELGAVPVTRGFSRRYQYSHAHKRNFECSVVVRVP